MRLLLLSLIVFGCFSLHAEEDEEFEPADAQITSTTIVEARSDNKNGQEGDDNYIVVFERFNVGLSQGDFETQARLDAALFFESEDTPLNAGFGQNLRLERLATSWTIDSLNLVLTGGDFFEQLGRGLTLSLRKQNEAGVDVALRGARLNYEDDAWSVHAFGGVTNPANIDAVNQRFVEDARDVLVGGEALLQTEFVRIGTYALYNQPRESVLEENTDRSVTVGTTMSAVDLLGWLTLYGEGAVQYRQLAGAPDQGSALYLNSDARFGNFALNVESMWLSAFEQRGGTNTALGNRFSYNQPPTLERIDQEVVNNRDVIGLRIRAEYYFENLDLVVYANSVGRLNDFGDAAEVRQNHTFAGIQWTLPGGASRLGLAGGYRDEARQIEGERTPLRNMRNVDVDWLQAIGGGVSVHTTHQAQFWEFQGTDFVRGSSFLGLEKGGFGSATFEFGYDTQNKGRGIRNAFYAGIVSLELPTFGVADGALFKGSLGTQRGGIKCVAGVCREFPPFSGLRGELITRF